MAAFFFDEVSVEDNGCFSSSEVKVTVDSFDDPFSVEENGCKSLDTFVIKLLIGYLTIKLVKE